MPAPLWHVSFINPPSVTTVDSINDAQCGDLVPQIGISGTPVIDTTTGTLYVVANTKENGVFFQRLHALDITTGNEKFGGPVAIQATVPGRATEVPAGRSPSIRCNRTSGPDCCCAMGWCTSRPLRTATSGRITPGSSAITRPTCSRSRCGTPRPTADSAAYGRAAAARRRIPPDSTLPPETAPST